MFDEIANRLLVMTYLTHQLMLAVYIQT